MLGERQMADTIDSRAIRRNAGAVHCPECVAAPPTHKVENYTVYTVMEMVMQTQMRDVVTLG